MDFGKLNFTVGFNRTSAFPLDANSYFENYTDAVAAAAGAAEVGSADSAYYIGQLIIVKDENNFGLYQISATKTLVKFGQASSEADLQSQLNALVARVDGLDTSKAGWVDGTAPEASAGGSLIVFDASGKIDASGIKVVDSAVNNSAMEVPTSKAVQTYVATQVAGAVQYLGTVSALTGLSTTAGKGDFYRLSAAIEGAHAGDLVVAEKNNPAQLIDGENWSLIHGEEVGVEDINAGAGINVSGSKAQPTIAVKPATTTAIGGIKVGTNLSITADGTLSATDTTYEDATQTVPGLMSADDKKKLDEIAEKATAVTVDDKFTANSANPVQSKVIQTEFNSVRTLVSDTESSLQGKIDQVSANLSSAQTTLQANIDDKVDKVAGKGLSTNDYTNADKEKLAGLSNYTLPTASADALGGIKIGYSGTAERTYAVQLDTNNKAYVNVPWTDDTNQKITAKSGGSTVAFGVDDTIEIVAGAHVTVTPDTAHKTITIASTDTNTAHSHSAGVGLTGSGTAGTSGTYTYKVNLVNEALSTNAATYTAGGTSKFYAVQLDKNSKLGVYVPWENNTFRPIKVNNGDVDAAASIKFVNGTNISLALEHKADGDNITINHAGPGSASQTTTGTKGNPDLVEDGGTVNFGADFYVPSFGIDANGHTRELKMTKYSLPTPEKFSLKPATTTTLGGIKAGNGTENFSSGAEGTAKNYIAQVEVDNNGLATVDLAKLVHDSDQADHSLGWGIEAGYTYIDVVRLSTDKLVQGANTLIINGGGAEW